MYVYWRFWTPPFLPLFQRKLCWFGRTSRVLLQKDPAFLPFLLEEAQFSPIFPSKWTNGCVPSKMPLLFDFSFKMTKWVLFFHFYFKNAISLRFFLKNDQMGACLPYLLQKCHFSSIFPFQNGQMTAFLPFLLQKCHFSSIFPLKWVKFDAHVLEKHHFSSIFTEKRANLKISDKQKKTCVHTPQKHPSWWSTHQNPICRKLVKKFIS